MMGSRLLREDVNGKNSRFTEFQGWGGEFFFLESVSLFHTEIHESCTGIRCGIMKWTLIEYFS